MSQAVATNAVLLLIQRYSLTSQGIYTDAGGCPQILSTSFSGFNSGKQHT